MFMLVATYVEALLLLLAVCRDALLPLLLSSLHCSIMLAVERGSSSWLTTLFLSEHGFSLHKGMFYGWQPPLLCTFKLCVCGKQFSIEHAFGCPCGGFPTIRHNELQDITVLTEVCHNVRVELLYK